MIKIRSYLSTHFFPVIPEELREIVQQQLLDKIYKGLVWVGTFMFVHIVLKTLWMFEKVPLIILLPWACVTAFCFLMAFPLWYYHRRYKDNYKNYFWYRWLFVLSFFASILFGLTPWLMFDYLHPSEVILFSAVLSFGVVVQIMVFGGFISLWLVATLPVFLLVVGYSYFYWSFNYELGRYFAAWSLVSTVYMFFMALQHNKKQIELLILRWQLNDANNAKSRFLAVMSHEVRTPLSSIIGMTDLLKENPLNQKQTQYANNIHSAGRNLLHILNNILLISSLQSKRPILKEEEFEIQILIDEVVQIFALNAKQKQLKLYWYIEPQVPHMLLGDAARLRQILINLLTNAIKFTESGVVKLILKREVSGKFRFSIYDTGIGIDAVSKQLIFNEFSQVGSLQNSNIDGVGLGLTIVAELVKLLQGEIILESEIGEGSCFHIILPLDTVENSLKQKNSINSAYTGAIDLILVEDDVLNREITTLLLQRHGHSVQAVCNAEHVFVQIKNKVPQLILTDLNLPKMGGIALAKKLRRSHPELPIIALTANATRETYDECLSVGMRAVLTKPIDAKALNQAVVGQIKETYLSRNQIDTHIVFSPKVIQELSDVMDHTEIEALYLSSIEKIQLELNEIEQKNRVTQTQLHRLSGSCSNLGFLQLSQQLVKIKTYLSEGECHQELLESLPDILQKSRNKLIEYLASTA
jgi:signal transduction histidine kinase/CheY-like chemotaxis protein